MSGEIYLVRGVENTHGIVAQLADTCHGQLVAAAFALRAACQPCAPEPKSSTQLRESGAGRHTQLFVYSVSTYTYTHVQHSHTLYRACVRDSRSMLGQLPFTVSPSTKYGSAVEELCLTEAPAANF